MTTIAKRLMWVALEVAFIGMCTAGLFYFVHGAHMRRDAQGAMAHRSLYGHAFVTGALLHLGFEMTGGNRRYCEMYVDPDGGRSW